MTQEQLAKITDKLDFDLVKSMFEKYEINSPLREAMFLAQVAHESGEFKHTQENLNYSADGLLKVFPKYFKDKNPNDYARNPQKIANLVYSNRMGNGDENSGDGYKFRGRGYIQLTGRDNYLKFLKYKYHADTQTLDNLISYLETPEGSLESALFFWQSNGLNKYADARDIKECTRRINGGYNGLVDREKKYNQYLAILQG